MASLNRAPAVDQFSARIFDAIWQGGGTALGVAPDTSMSPIVGRPTPSVNIGGGTTTLEAVNGLPLIRMANAAAAAVTPVVTLYDLMFRGKVLQANAGPANLEMDPIYRVRWRLKRTQNGAVRGNVGLGVGLIQSAAALAQVPTTGTGGGVTFNMNAGGTGWEVNTKRQLGGALVTTPVNWLTDTVFATVEFRITPARSGVDAQLQILLDGVEIFSQSWGLGLLPDFTGAGAPYRLIPAMFNQTVGATDFLDLESFRITVQSQA